MPFCAKFAFCSKDNRMVENRDIIKMLFETDIYDKIKSWVQINGATGSILFNLGEYDLYGNNKEFGPRTAIEWICRNWGNENTTNNYYAVKTKGNKIELYYMTLPDNASWGYSKSKYAKMGTDEREVERGRMEGYSYVIFTLMKIAGYKIKLYKRMNTDLQSEYGSGKTIRDVNSRIEWIRQNKERPDIAKKKIFYFKEGSYYYIYSISPKYYSAVMEILSDFKVDVRTAE
jgi:hypothetical protein